MICYAKVKNIDEVNRILEYAFSEGHGGDVIAVCNEDVTCIPCPNPEFDRDDIINM